MGVRSAPGLHLLSCACLLVTTSISDWAIGSRNGEEGWKLEGESLGHRRTPRASRLLQAWELLMR